MKKIIYNIALILGVVFIMFACSDMDEMQIGTNNMKKHTCIMKFDAEAPSFESDSVTTRASGSSWEDGDEIYIYFSEHAYGKGKYSASENQWKLYYTGVLGNESENPCTVYYVKAGSPLSGILSGTKISLDELSAVYADENASYYLSNNTLTLIASIKPYCTRVRFKGNPSQKFSVQKSSEIKYYTQIDISNNQCQSEGKTLSLTVNSDGYTDFLYVTPLSSDAILSLSVGKSIYTRTLSTSFFSLGASGVFQIPSSETLYGWQQKKLSSARLIGGTSFNKVIRALAGDSQDYSTKCDKIKEIIFDYNSNVSNGELVSGGGFPIYANFSNGIITISTAADIINVTDMGGMFGGCSSLASLDLSGFDTSNVTDMGGMFDGCSSLSSVDLSSFDTSNVTNMSRMFYLCVSLHSLDLSSFDTSNVTDMGKMFYACHLHSFDLSSFDTSNVTNMSRMFGYCSLTSFDLSSFDTSNVTDMSYMFMGCSSLHSLDLSSFDTSNVTNMSAMFIGCNSLTSLDLSSFDTSNVTNMSAMFGLLADGSWHSCSSLASLDLSGFDTSNVTDMGGMFDGCSSLTSLDLSSFDTSNVTYMRSMFFDCSSLTSLDLSSFDNSKVTDMSYMFYNCSSLSSVDLSSFDTSNVTTMNGMFYNCSSLSSVDLSSFDTSNVTDMSGMFYGCSSLSSVDLRGFDTSKVTNMVQMFYGCSSLSSVDLSSFDTSKVTTMSSMFYGCSSLSSVDLSSFDTSNVTDMRTMFNGCSSLTSLDLRNFDTSNVKYMYDMFRDVKNCIIRCTNATMQNISSKTDIDDTVTFEIV